MHAAPYPDDGAVLVVSRHASEDTVAPAVVGWQVMRLSASGEHCEVGNIHPRLLSARQAAETTFPNIVRWEKLSATVLAAVVPVLAAHVPVAAAPGPRRRANGLRLPSWRA